jgi:hypothetical protein
MSPTLPNEPGMTAQMGREPDSSSGTVHPTTAANPGTGDQNDEMQRVLRELRDPDGPDTVEVGDIPTYALSRWPSLATDRGIITRTQRSHYLDSHPEMIGAEHLVVAGLIDPDAVAQMLDAEATALFYRREDDRHDIAIIVSISHDPARANSVITARRQRRSRRGKPRMRTGVFWEKGEKE